MSSDSKRPKSWIAGTIFEWIAIILLWTYATGHDPVPPLAYASAVFYFLAAAMSILNWRYLNGAFLTLCAIVLTFIGTAISGFRH